MKEKLSPKTVSLSLATVSGIVYILCAVFFILAPQTAISVSKDLFHGIDLTQIMRTTVPLESIIAGFVEILVLSLVIGWLFAAVYNYLVARIK